AIGLWFFEVKIPNENVHHGLGGTPQRLPLVVCCRRKPKEAIRSRIASSTSRLDRPDVFRLPALRTLGHVEFHRLAFLQALETACLDGGEMHENIFARLPADETVALGIVEPLHSSLFHVVLVFLFVYLRWRESEETCAGYWLLRRELLTTDSV